MEMRIRKLTQAPFVQSMTLAASLTLTGTACDGHGNDEHDDSDVTADEQAEPDWDSQGSAVTDGKQPKPRPVEPSDGSGFMPRPACDTIQGMGNVVLNSGGGAARDSACPDDGSIVASMMAAEQERALAPFSGLRVEGVFDLELTTGPQAVVLRTSDNLLQFVETTVSERTLSIGFAPAHNYYLHEAPKLSIASPRLTSIQAEGLARVRGESTGERMELGAFGIAKIKLLLTVTGEVVADAGGGGQIELTGSANQLSLVAVGTSSIDSELDVAKAQVSASGLASVRVRARDSVQIDVSGLASVTVIGNPTQREIHGDASRVKFER